jgi:tetratricopeptide (TPR) repeat protein
VSRTRSAVVAWSALLLAAAVVLLYAPVRDFGFVTFDDPEYVSQNPHLRGGLTWTGLRWAFTTPHAANWHPLTWLSHMLDWSLFGGWAGGHHLTSVALHAASAAVLLIALVRLTGAPWESAVAAAAFALHPLRVESVAWVSERKDVLATLAWVAAMLAYARFVERRTAARYALVLAAFAVGLLAKPMVVTLPFALLLLDVWPLDRPRRDGWRRLVLEKVPLLVLSAAAALVTFRVQSSAGAVASLEHQPLPARLANAVLAYVAYVWKTVWPSRLACFYPQAAEYPMGPVLAALGVLGLVTAIALHQRRRRPYLLVGWLWFVGTLVPVIGVVRAGDQAMADRFTYIPSIGLVVAGAWLAGEAARRSPRAWWTATAAAAIVLIAWSATTATQLRTWRDSRALYAHALAVTTGNHLADGNLGLLLLEENDVDEAMRHFRAAVEARPASSKAHVNLGVGLATLGRHDDALREYEAAVGLDPRLPVAHYNLGLELSEHGRVDEAVSHYETAIRLDPDYAPPHVNLGLVLANRGRLDDAIAHYRTAIALDPRLPAAYNNLAVALERTGAIAEALDAYRAAVRLQPSDPRARFNLGAVLLGQGAAREAAEQYREVVRLDPTIPEAHAALAESLAATGDIPGATAAFEQALRHRPDWPEVRARIQELTKHRTPPSPAR